MNAIEAMIFNLKTAMTAMNEMEMKGFANISRWMDAMKIISSTITSLEKALEEAKKEDGKHADRSEGDDI